MQIRNERFYVGSSANLKARLSFHRSRITNWDKDYNNNNGSLLFYKSVLKEGWDGFKFGVLEYIDVSNKDSDIRKVLFGKEQYYIDNINPSLNICRIASSPLGIKHGISFSINLSKARRGKKNKATNYKPTATKFTLPDTILKLSSRSKGIKVKIIDVSNNIVKEFTTLTSAAKYRGVSNRTMARILNSGISYDDFSYEFYVVTESPITVCKGNEVIKEYYSLRAAAKDIGVTHATLINYVNTNKLLKGIYTIHR